MGPPTEAEPQPACAAGDGPPRQSYQAAPTWVTIIAAGYMAFMILVVIVWAATALWHIVARGDIRIGIGVTTIILFLGCYGLVLRWRANRRAGDDNGPRCRRA